MDADSLPDLEDRSRDSRALGSLLERLAKIGAGPEDSQAERVREGALILGSVAISLLAFVWVGTYAAYGHFLSAAIPATYQVVTVVGLLALHRSKRFDVFRTVQLGCFLLLPALLQLSLGGFVPGSAVVLWSMATPLTALALLGRRRAIPWLVAFSVAVVALALIENAVSIDVAPLPPRLVLAFFAMNCIGTALASFVLLGYFVHQSELARVALAAERERSEHLLLNVLPEPIAKQLKEREGVIAEHHESVTVLFADLVGFTQRTEGMPADDIVRLLDEVFSAFDEIVAAEGLEKIKTIGDAYMVAGGLPEPRPDHLHAVARAALAMQRDAALIAQRADRRWVSMRMGIDTGPVVAGVIGRRKFIYDIWGDTVNTASRMESHGVPGRIQVTARVAQALEDSYVLEPRGSIDVKGKAPMETFLLVGEA